MKGRMNKARLKNNIEPKSFLYLLTATKNGATVQEVKLWNKSEYWINYPQGGCERISLTNFKKLTNGNH
jgi:hypothetical protein